MKAEPGQKTIGELIELHKNSMLKANPEYQRGIVWTKVQQQKLIDSVLRGYQLPLIYLHHITRQVAGMRRDDLEIIDGQQRIFSFYQFSEGSFKLLDPSVDDRLAKFPKFIKDQASPWAAKDIHSLSDDLKARFLGTTLAVAMIESEDENEVRDLFVRLQSGQPLNSQETRDAWPGDFTDFVLRLGGKANVARYPGHEFFSKTLGMKPGTDRGKTRQLAAQIAMLFLSRRWNGEGAFADINAKSLDDFYYENLSFDLNSPDCERLWAILDILHSILGKGKHAKLHGHDAIHLTLLVDGLWDEYTPVWRDKLPVALDKFLAAFAESKQQFSGDYWIYYGMWTRQGADRAVSISIRHKFYVERMMEFMGSLPKKDPKRLFGEVEKAILFYRQNKRCANCGSTLSWDDTEVHHVEEHSKGGRTLLDNGAAVHKGCHPKGDAATKEFAERFFSRAKAAVAD